MTKTKADPSSKQQSKAVEAKIEYKAGRQLESKSESKSTRKPNSTRIVAIDLNPQTYSDDFNLTHELQSNIDFYRGDECVSLRPIPGYLRESIERYQLSFATKRPGINPIAAACIWGGMQSLRTQATIKALATIKEKFHALPRNTGGNTIDIVRGWFSHFQADVMPAYTSGNTSLNISLPEPINAALDGMSANLSISKGQLASVLIADIIRHEDTTIDDHCKRMDEAVNVFLILCQARLGAMESILDVMKQGSRAKR